ncbi:MAG: hypothetical protein SO067_03975 [Bacilli bacterium]|nr:hypothetical protein [Bacilli bacterium]
MNDKIIELEEYKNLIQNKNDLDNKIKEIDDLSLEELEDLNKLYRGEVSKLSQEVKALEEENIKLKRLLGK